MADELVHGYAEALFKVAQTEGVLDKVEDELFRFGKLLETNHELKQALADSNSPRSERIKVLDELLADKVSRHTMGLVTFIVAQDRARQLPQILEEVSRIAAEARKSVLAEVRSAVPLDDDQSRQLADALSKATGLNVTVKVLVDESVIGGIYAKVGDTIIDGTIKRRLEQLKEQVKA
jgi:F-type H+-transporting ATPase subunit delta